jgi:enoyl-CoA hydratase/carnithine racemase
MSYNTVLYEVADKVATVTLNRPDRMNSITDEMTTELFEAMTKADTDPAARVIVLTGAGRAFCAGGDIGGFDDNDPKMLAYKLPRLFDMNERPDYQTRHIYFPLLRKPVIGMINGAVAGLGMAYALSCDIRFASDKAVFATAYARRGLSAEYGTGWLLQRIVGHANALDLFLSARKLDATEACALGVYNKVFAADELKQYTYDYARELATWCAPSAMRALKRQIWDAPFQTLHEAVIVANRQMEAANSAPDFKEGVASFREKRTPEFRNIEDVDL